MLDKIIAFLKFSNQHGMLLPTAHDPVPGKPSVSLLFAYLSFIGTFVTNCYLTYKDPTLGTTGFIIFFTLCMVFYLIRRLKKFSADLDDKSINLEGEDEEKT
jgi:hypothetical protein